MIQKKLRTFLKDCHGASGILIFGACFLLAAISLIIIERDCYAQTSYRIETGIERSLTSAVECNMDYRYRSDKVLYLYINSVPPEAPDDDTCRNFEQTMQKGGGAYHDFLDALASDLSAERSGNTIRKEKNSEVIYQIDITEHGGDDCVACESPKMYVCGTVTRYPIFAGIVGKKPVVTKFCFESHDFRIDS